MLLGLYHGIEPRITGLRKRSRIDASRIHTGHGIHRHRSRVHCHQVHTIHGAIHHAMLLLLLLLLKKLSRTYAARVHVHAYTTSTHKLGRVDGTTAKDVLRELLLLLGTKGAILKASSKHGRVDSRSVGA